jgi:cell division protein FtsZ
MGVGRASGEQRALKATHQAISSPLFEEATIQRAKGVLINVTGGLDLTLHEVSDASSLISQAADENANIIFGAVIDENMHDEMRITVIATGFDKEAETVEEAEGTVEQLPPDLLRNDTLSLDLPVKRAAATQRTDDFNIPTYIRRRVAK